MVIRSQEGAMRTILLSIIPFMIALLLVGCGSDSDFQGTILEVEESSITVGEDDVDPEASYPSYEIMIDDKTKFSGEVERFNGLDKWVHPIVHIWLNDKGKNNEMDNRVASKVFVEKD